MSVFDPFLDFEENGYLQNRFKEKDPNVIRELEHTMFRAGLDDALEYLSKRDEITYRDFLEVHKILFSEIYPWAGKDRNELVPDKAISKAGVKFCHPMEIQRSIDYGLRLGQDKEYMRANPGEVMGLFAYGHPFLDGNGRTMLLIHTELCHRAGFSIEWEKTTKFDYLTALSKEIEKPRDKTLNAYLSQFVGSSRNRDSWGGSIKSIKGLDGVGQTNNVDGDYSDEQVSREYRAYKLERERTE
ncbi:cell filamentation protein Fic [Vibrio navarrensis]|uniref:protein adenylyltransferase n=1 Tax=Vibrio navarrensis TaxID=29495 RepID=A0AAJ4LT10_9VIBR|nr:MULTISPECIES: Fic family protein [Vibrio]KJR22893.1 cell filamentation protein Fic [Vibrio sp. S234-5]MBE3659216.1 cell filamentation protein Fic [Vibrio navarrensis]MBE3663424.1 cell filamentation protein Fic [Vibrio navarrensis]MBE4606007.1 cell filamentation protein Fic [Vibrio navarrensis]QPL52150.1 Fic family protein [Vibrio navarrensis]